MNKKIIWPILLCLIAVSLILSSCGTKTTPTTTKTVTQTSAVTTTTTTKTTVPTSTQTAVEKPQYGGTFTYRMATDFRYFDPYWSDTTSPASFWYQTLATANLSIDRKIYDFRGDYSPIKYMAGELAENWEISADSKTVTFHIRKGIRWQNIAPVNGREFTAEDIVWDFNRQLGLGNGFTAPSPNINAGNYSLIDSITASDKYTVVFKLKSPSLDQLFNLVDDHWVVYIVAREAVEKWGDVNDWKHQIGTGPFILDDYVSGSSLSMSKNQNYWGKDYAHPENSLPYLDNVKALIIPDLATALAAVRTGKIDLIENINWQQAKSIAKTNPELLQVTRPTVAFGIVMQVDRKPYSDIKVRQAMQKAIDIPALATSYYGGLAQGIPMGIVGTQGYYIPYNEWAADVKEGYKYDPAAAKKLLADAGYPNGFKAVLSTSNANDLDLVQVLKAYLFEVGIDAEINSMDPTSYVAYKQAEKTELAFDWCTVNFPPVICLNVCYSGSPVYWTSRHIKDTIFDDLRNKAKASFIEEEQADFVKQADMRAISQQWIVNTPSAPVTCIYQPWLMRFNGETRVPQRLSPYLWIDQKLKTSMGR